MQCPHSALRPAWHLGDNGLTNVQCESKCEGVSLYLCVGMQYIYGPNASIYGYILHVVGVTYLCGEDATESGQQKSKLKSDLDAMQSITEHSPIGGG